MTAVQSASIDKVCYLLDRCSDVNARDGRGFTALHPAAEMDTLRCYECSSKVVRRRILKQWEALHDHLLKGVGNREIMALLDRYIACK